MNFSTVIGFVAAMAVFLHSTLTATDDRQIFLNEHGIIIVIGGTLAAGAICFPIKKIFMLSWVAFKKMLFGYKVDYATVIKELIDIGERVRNDPQLLKREAVAVKNPFLREALELVNDGFSEQQIREILAQRIEAHEDRNSSEMKMFQTLSKFPPAFGLLGTTLGMISLLQKLAGEDALKKIGPAMAIGLVATLYGIALTNFVFIPIAENLADKSREDTTMRQIILEGVILLKHRVHPVMIREKLNSYLLPAERMQARKS